METKKELSSQSNKSQKNMKLKTIRNLLLVLALLIFTGFSGYWLGNRNFSINTKAQNLSNIINSEPPVTKEVDFSLFWNVWDRLEKSYIDKTKLNPRNMVYGAISGMVGSLEDPYTVFLAPTQQKEAKEELGGSFEGIGAQLGMKDKRIIVISPLANMPAEAAGIKAGDWIVKVDGTETYGWTVPEAVNKIRGTGGTKVSLTILHEGQDKTQDIDVIRGAILVKSVEWNKTYWNKTDNHYKNDQNCTTCVALAHLKLTRFGDQTNKEWNLAVSEINKEIANGQVKGVIFDLRNNPGGYLQGAVYIASEFLKEGLVVVQQEYYDGQKETFSVNRKGQLLNTPVEVLINKGSASASEIVAGALKDYNRAKLVGEKSFGKGSIQEAQDLPGGAGLHITIARWLLPKGDWINGKGVEPQLTVSLDDNNPTLDTQLESGANDLLNSI